MVDKGVLELYNKRMSVKDELLKKLLDGELVSGAELSAQLSVSRNAVWKAVQELEKAGYEIASGGGGYKLTGGNVLSEAALSRYLTSSFSIDVEYETDSTNNIAKGYAEQGKTAIVVSDGQRKGRGRLGREFFAPHGTGAYFSVVLRPVLSLERAQLLTAYAAVVAAKAVERLSGGEVKIKWVNDLFMGGKKICGILTEASVGIEGSTLDYAVVGIGINVYKTELPDHLRGVATSIEAETGVKIDRNELIALIANGLAEAEGAISNGKFMNDYRIMSNIIHREVLVNGEYSAFVRGIEDDGAILLESSGAIKKMNGGEVSLKLK